MESIAFIANKGKNVAIEALGQTWLRHAVRTRFVRPGESYLALMKEYVLPLYERGDLVSISEKVISICQGRLIHREDLPVGFWARFLSRFANRTNRGGYGVGLPINMQYAIRTAGLPRVLLAAAAGGLGKLFGVKGVFYRIAGRNVSGLDGFYDGVWKEYRDIGIELPHDPGAVCNEIKDTLGISCMIVDANELGQEILGKSEDILWSDGVLKKLIRDNPAGQGRECTPFILIRRQRK